MKCIKTSAIITEKSIIPTEVGITFLIKNKIELDTWYIISKAGFLFDCGDCTNQLEIAKIIKIIVNAFNKLNIELLKENKINFSKIISLPNIELRK